jgi:hypothetical protein
MSNQRLIHDIAYATALHLLQTVQGCLREEEHRDAFEEFYGIVKAGLEAFAIHDERRLERLYGPRRN